MAIFIFSTDFPQQKWPGRILVLEHDFPSNTIPMTIRAVIAKPVLYYRKEINMKLAALVGAVLFSVVCLSAETFSTENTTSDVHLENGVAVHLAPHSNGAIYSDHAVLEEGAAHVSNFSGYKVQAGGLQIEAETPNTQAAIRVQGNFIEIASLGGNLAVSAGGVPLTRVAAGSRLSFQNSGATGASPAKRPHSEVRTWTWVIVGIAAAALAIGLTAAAQGKSPF